MLDFANILEAYVRGVDFKNARCLTKGGGDKGGGDTKSTPADTRPAPKAQPGNPKGLY